MNGEKLKGQWGHKGSASTEDLRLALRDGGSQKGSHFGIGVVPPPTARSPESLSLLSGRSCRTARSCQGRAVVGRGEANP